MKKGGVGGANTQTGIKFEGRVDLLTKLDQLTDYEVNGHTILFKGEEVAYSYRKNSLYVFLKEQGVDYKNYISKRLLPDDAIYVIKDNTVYIIEMKFQIVAGSVDEKLQTCDFKKKQYQKLFASLNYEVEYIYVLSDWFRKEEYKDVRDYIVSVGCRFYFEYLPLKEIGLPVPKLN
ncbi:hypothetical protein H0V99_01050 [Candidatus Saccharibacteria bacterium]|nr:hypothetical protein [Candidatus Saccharibacteria bacterium]